MATLASGERRDKRTRPALLLLGTLIALIAVGYLAGWLVTRVFEGFFLEDLDRPISEALARNRTEGWNSFMKGATTLGAGAFVTFVTIAAGIASYLWTRDPRWPLLFLLSGFGTFFDKTLKPLVGRDRPQIDPVIDIGGNSFPSGHATAAAAFFLTLAFFLSRRWPRFGAVIWVMAVAVVVLVLATRVYLGVHWTTDVIAGALLSGTWIWAAAGAVALRGTKPAPE